MTQEVLEAGPRAHPRARRGIPAVVIWVVGLAALVVLTVVASAAVGDLAARTVEGDQLLTAVEASELAMSTAQAEFDTVVSEYDVDTMTDADREELLDRLGEVAARGEVAIAQAGQGVAEVDVLPWHTNIARARDAYLAHNAAWGDDLAAAAQDPTEWFAPQPAVNETFAEAKTPLVEAIPLLDLGDLLKRVEAIYVDGSEPADSGGGTAA